jgi:hypothetical protein
MINRLTTVACAIAASLLAACVGPPAPDTEASFATSSGAEQAVPAIASKTFAAPVNDVRMAVLKSLYRMDVKVTMDGKTERGWKITAVDNQRVIDIQLEPVAPNTTRMRVIVGEGGRDFERATEIVLQTSDALGPLPVPYAKPRSRTA